MVSTVNLQRLVECREHEETRLHILISQRRKRKLDDMIAEESSTANSSVTQKHPQHPPDKSFLSDIWSKATQLHAFYTEQSALEKAFVFLTLNSIINLTFDYTKIANVSKQKVNAYKEKNAFADPQLRQVSRRIMKHITKHATSEAPAIGRFVDCSIRFFPRATKEELSFYRIYSHFLMIFDNQKESINAWRLLSENDIFRLFISPVMEIIFENSIVRLRSGETTTAASAEVRDVQAKAAGIRSRGAFKVDLRLVLLNNQIEYDLANCEFSKSGDVQRKVIVDNVQLAVEGKCIIDHLLTTSRLDEEQAKKIQVVNLQACGLKMRLLALKLDRNGDGYVTQPIGSIIKLPTSVDTIPAFFQDGLPLLQHMKEVAEKNALMLQDAFNRDRSSFGSASPPHPTNIIKKTWLGPSSSNPSIIPPIPHHT
ncbi:hypothetical protein LRAMOSA02411 [Lichtheimia ramosa]|uniref:Uncharacterized protein n=1 Tax=Lichtheimia ramosa TaxID=688394 RepID=A0A077WRC5_9FUNG|nr:hypothetical protein LRAMOSA02411 [Lichtheimia ramosa]